ncbi:hypothetical protein QQP08_000796 [Theobroma cacao]|nr:hypothetical protein QQP08_000796 [Theobroma cacao]
MEKEGMQTDFAKRVPEDKKQAAGGRGGSSSSGNEQTLPLFCHDHNTLSQRVYQQFRQCVKWKGQMGDTKSSQVMTDSVNAWRTLTNLKAES